MIMSIVLQAFVTYFDAVFSQCHRPIQFSTSPSCPPTHWRQTSFYLRDEVRVSAQDVVTGTFRLQKNDRNKRDVDFEIFAHFVEEDDRDVDYAYAYKLGY